MTQLSFLWGWTIPLIINFIIITMEILNYLFKWNDTRNNKLKLPVGGG